MPEPRLVSPPADGLWRIGRGINPLQPAAPPDLAELRTAQAGNRFDSLTGQFRVLYFATDLTACFGETLSRFRKDPKLAFLDEEWDELHFMPRGAVPKDWRTNRSAVRVSLRSDLRFLDVEDAGTREFLFQELGSVLAMFGIDALDVAAIRGRDRRVTQLIAQFGWIQENRDGSPMLAGIRYLSRLNNEWECWAVYDRVDLEEEERHPILRDMPALREIEDLYGLRVF